MKFALVIQLEMNNSPMNETPDTSSMKSITSKTKIKSRMDHLEKIFPHVRPEEKFNSYSHFAASVLAILGTIYLIFRAYIGMYLLIPISIYGFGLIFIYLASGIWHAHKQGSDQDSIWQKIDEIAIYFMIAGTFTPLTIAYLDGFLKGFILSFQWILVGVGTGLKLVTGFSNRRVVTLIYLGMGWMAIIPIGKFFQVMPSLSLIALISGGIVYTIGAIIYMTKKIPHFHEIFHILIILGSGLHYITILGTLHTVS